MNLIKNIRHWLLNICNLLCYGIPAGFFSDVIALIKEYDSADEKLDEINEVLNAVDNLMVFSAGFSTTSFCWLLFKQLNYYSAKYYDFNRVMIQPESSFCLYSEIIDKLVAIGKRNKERYN